MLFKHPYPFNYSARDFRKRLVLTYMKDQYEEIFEFFEKYLDLEKLKDLDDPYVLEALKLDAIVKYELGGKKEINSELISRILRDYHGLYDSKQEDHLKSLRATQTPPPVATSKSPTQRV